MTKLCSCPCVLLCRIDSEVCKISSRRVSSEPYVTSIKGYSCLLRHYTIDKPRGKCTRCRHNYCYVLQSSRYQNAVGQRICRRRCCPSCSDSDTCMVWCGTYASYETRSCA